MSDAAAEAIRVSKLLGFDYSQFENTKVSAEKRKALGEGGRVRNKKILVSPVRAVRPNAESAKSNIRSTERGQSYKRPVTELGDKIQQQTADQNVSPVKPVICGRKSVEPDQLNVAQQRKTRSVIKVKNDFNEIITQKRECHTDVKKKDTITKGGTSEDKARNSVNEKAENRKSVDVSKDSSRSKERRKSSLDRVDLRLSDEKRNSSNSPRLEKDKQFMEVKRRLDFNEEQVPSGLDFTDKLAALRSLISRDRQTGDISDRRAYYGEYRSSNRRVIVSRSDSLKENFEELNNVGLDERQRNDINKVGQTPAEKYRRSQSADLFKNRNLDGRLSETELNVLKSRLEKKHENKKVDSRKKELEVEKVQVNNSVENSLIPNVQDDLFDKYLTKSNDLIHAKKGRKILTASSRSSGIEVDTSEAMDIDSRPSSRLESKETQTNVLNQSIRSVQSNAPFYEPPGRPMSAPIFNCEVSVGRKKTVVGGSNVRNVGRLENDSENGKVTTKAAYDADRHPDVGSFEGKRLTSGKSKHSLIKNDVVVRKRSRDITSQRHDLGNLRPSSRNGHIGTGRESIDIHSSSGKLRPLVNHTKNNNAVNEDVFEDELESRRLTHSVSKSERKVREWIKKQEKLMKEPASGKAEYTDSGPMAIEELSISISIPTNSPFQKQQSPSDSCDRIPVKLEKSRNSNSNSLSPSAAYGIIQPLKPGSPLTRQAIFDKLEHITMALTTQQHQLEVEIPVKDIENARESRGKTPVVHTKPVENSDTASTESSIFSLPFSVRSGESLSSTCQAVKLLRRLYNVDTEERQNLVLMAKCFRRWFNNVLHARERNLQITNAAKPVSPVSYGVMLRESDTCYRSNLLSHCFNQWRMAFHNSQLHRKVVLLHRRHTLQKGMNAFKWAINRSKLQQGILQDRVNVMILNSVFNKWKQKTQENRRLRLQQAFYRWRQFTKEAQKIRMLRNQTNKKLKERMFSEWHDHYQTCQKIHRADAHARCILLSGSWASWRSYTAVSKEKKRRQSLALHMFKNNLQRKMFTCMKVEFVKYSEAKHFHRMSQLKVAMAAWKVGAEISQEERLEDNRVAEAYWSHTTLRTFFTLWRDTLLSNRACRMCDQNFTRNAFYTWKKRHEHLVQRRQSVDAYVRQKVLTRAFQHWYTFVVVMKQRRVSAVECLQSVLKSRMFEMWRWYTDYQKTLRKRMLLHVRKHNLDTQRRCLHVWRAYFKVKCDEKRAQQLWSNTCARRAAEVWRLVCRKKRLARLLIDTEPLRQLNTQRVHFLHWKARYELILEEKSEAAEVRAILDQSQLKMFFQRWHSDTKQLLLIKPMVLCYRERLVQQCFQDWRWYVVHKAQCLKSEQAVRTLRTCNKFKAWRRQYQVHQIQKEHNKKRQNMCAQKCLTAWRFVIQRKHQADNFRKQNLVRSTFMYWSSLALRQLREKRLQKMEMETVMSLLQEYFGRWREQLYLQQARDEENVTYLQERIETSRVKVAFSFWRRHFRATLVARENEKIRTRKLAKQAIQAWHLFTQNSLQEAVERFAAAIGIYQDEEEALSSEDKLSSNPEERDDVAEQSLGKGESMEMLNFDLQMSPRSVTSGTPRTPRTPKTPRTPRASAFGTPLRRIVSPSLSHHSLAQSLEFEAGPMVSPSFLDARFEMEQAVKTESRREIVVTVVTRLRHWPISIMFEQWKEYTARQREFKLLTTQMISIHQELSVRQYFVSWMQQLRAAKIAKLHYEQVLQHKALLSLILYRNHRQEKRRMNAMARVHYAVTVYNSVFPAWLAKAQEKQHTEKILHLWTNITDAERELIPRERSFRYKLNQKCVSEAFTAWLNRYRQIAKLKKVYHKILYERYFGVWCDWALERHERRLRCEQFRDNRRKRLVFKTWCLRHRQKQQVEKRHTDFWQTYQAIILRCWHHWAKEQRQQKVIAAYVTRSHEKKLVVRMFSSWKAELEKHQRVTEWHDSRLVQRVLFAWQNVASWQKDLKQRQQQCQLISYTALAKRAFRQWWSLYLHRQAIHQKHERVLQQRVLRLATHWRRKAQRTRGELLKQQFQKQQMGRLFSAWKCAYQKVLDKYDVLQSYLQTKQQSLTLQCLQMWRTELMCLQAGRVFNMKLMTTLLSCWKSAARGCRMRRGLLQTYVAQKENSIQRIYFLYWFNVAKARKSIRGHANLKIQLSVFKAWLVYTRKKINLRRLESAFTRKRNLRITKKYWYLVKTRFDYCVELSDTASRIIHDKNMTLMRRALEHWDFRLKIVIADECHEHILAKRTANRWRQFVIRRRQERQRMMELTEKAVKFYNKALCNKVFSGWFREVLATRHLEKRRQRLCVKYGHLWKKKVDMVYTAKCVRNENLCVHAWKIWHLEFARCKAMRKVEAFEKKQQLTMVFVSWKNLCRKRARKVSMIPLPVSPAHNMPTANSSGSSTPTDELMSPVLNKPSQLPMPKGKKKKCVSASSSPFTSAGSSPTGSVEKLTAFNPDRRGSRY